MIYFYLATNIIELAEIFLDEFVLILKIFIEAVAVFIIAFAVLKALAQMWHRRKNNQLFAQEGRIRLDLGISLVLALEFLLAADIVGTAISPSWSDLGKLAAVAGIRTFLNFFLEKEVKELEEKNNLNR
ncbi:MULTISPECIES: DUF1622 domain-containing protein [Okeania]|uniref:DUF1622 domain-containing protein n=2 Tax=Microcoleaceae TaxID=1892252 RepID=A0A3N6PE81_9CYAN|nr:MULTISPECIES: DUF1622 domain-containing protein [Okeania]NET15430.1 DUF1622 domain-containing protein [Okeania sp. SIO1H6]NET18095.1 DUF1622 domain-containing protein [Okeania sp. SIO1H5]NES77262.1 DUF1622 domain-containing protein [Okeania sp. SIO1H4]NES88190.1 DUF1622 domain-containing protein [Okeania sp. SIO2B9]NET76286.1 DUF1622 domain-containing protein [Okeania sp. SIO1F9]